MSETCALVRRKRGCAKLQTELGAVAWSPVQKRREAKSVWPDFWHLKQLLNLAVSLVCTLFWTFSPRTVEPVRPNRGTKKRVSATSTKNAEAAKTRAGLRSPTPRPLHSPLTPTLVSRLPLTPLSTTCALSSLKNGSLRTSQRLQHGFGAKHPPIFVSVIRTAFYALVIPRLALIWYLYLLAVLYEEHDRRQNAH